MLAQIAVSLEGGDKADSVDVFVDTGEIFPTLDDQEIDGRTYYRVQVPMAPIGGGDLEYVIAKMAFDAGLPVYLENEEDFNKFKASSDALEDQNTVDWDPLYEFMSNPQLFSELEVRSPGDETPQGIQVMPTPFTVGEDFPLKEGIGHGWDVTADIKITKSNLELNSVEGKFYIVSKNDEWISYLEIDAADLENAQGLSDDYYEYAIRQLQATLPGVYVGSEFRDDLVVDWSSDPFDRQDVDPARGSGWILKMPVYREGVVWKRDAEVGLLWSGAAWSVTLEETPPDLNDAAAVTLESDEVAALSGGAIANGDEAEASTAWDWDALRESAEVYVEAAQPGMWPIGDAEPLKVAAFESEFLAWLGAPLDASAWEVEVKLEGKDNFSGEFIVFGIFFVAPNPQVYGEQWSYLMVDPENSDHSGNAELKAELGKAMAAE